jgi:AcrR family transcriptional regulator
MLVAADALFAGGDSLQTVSMDDIAAAAGVGKGTLFRAFGSRDGLLDAGYGAHVLLNALRPDLIDEVLATGSTPEAIRDGQANSG